MPPVTAHTAQSNGEAQQQNGGGGPSVQFSPQQDRTYNQPQHAQGRSNTTQQMPTINNVGSTSSNNGQSKPKDAQHSRIGGGSSSKSNNPMARRTQPTPLFERLVTEEVQELKAYARIIENQNRRLAELERIHGDLESRLEVESREKIQLEATLEEREREWQLKFRTLEKDRDHWKSVVDVEDTKNKRLMAQISRKDQDIQNMLLRKYDNKGEARNHPSHTMPIRNVRHMNERSGASSQSVDRSQQEMQRSDRQFNSPHEILAASGSMEAVRIRNVKNLLEDFFGT